MALKLDGKPAASETIRRKRAVFYKVLTLEQTGPQAGKQWTDSGEAHDDRLFRSERGNVVSGSNYFRVWQMARPLALKPDQVDSPVAGRPYDLRHAAVSLWLSAGVPATEVAERAAHTVDVLLKVYAKCIDGQRDVINKRIAQALSDAVRRE